MTRLDESSLATTEKPPLRIAPFAPGLPFIGSAFPMRANPLEFMQRSHHDLGDVFQMRLGPYISYVFRNPDHVRRIFVDNAANYTKQTRGFEKSRLVLGEGLVTSEGALWQRQRRIATPAFHRQKIAGFARTMVQAADDMLTHWQTVAANNQVIDLSTELMACSLRIATETLLGVGAGDDTREINVATSIVLERTNDIITNPLSLPTWVPTRKNITFNRAIARLDKFVYDTIARKRAKATAAKTDDFGDDLLSMLMGAKDEQTGEGMSDLQLRDEAVTILIAGHETVANAVTWAFYLLSQSPPVMRDLRAELDTLLSGRLPTVEDFPKLKFTRQVIDETMRLYPPAWAIGRAATEADEIGGFLITPKAYVLVSPYLTHRHPAIWDNAEGFDPYRWSDGRTENLPKFAYLPFGGGQRFCIGSTFAMMEAVLLLATIAQRCTLSLVGGFPVVPYAMITLRPKFGMKMTVKWGS